MTLKELAIQADRRRQASWNAFSGADQAEGEVWRCVRDFYMAVSNGGDVEAELAKQDANWRQYAEQQNRKVAAAPRLKRGPSAGHSSIAHRWVSPDLFQQKAIHLRHMVKALTNE